MQNITQNLSTFKREYLNLDLELEEEDEDQEDLSEEEVGFEDFDQIDQQQIDETI
jgi:hypothetical protein